MIVCLAATLSLSADWLLEEFPFAPEPKTSSTSIVKLIILQTYCQCIQFVLSLKMVTCKININLSIFLRKDLHKWLRFQNIVQAFAIEERLMSMHICILDKS